MRPIYAKLFFTGAFALTSVSSTCHSAETNVGWIRAETKHFIVYSDANEAQTREYLSKLEAFYVTASSLYVQVSDSAIDYKQKPVFYYIKNIGDDYTIYPQLKSSPDAHNGILTIHSICQDGETSAYTDADFMTTYFNGDYRFLSLNLYLKRVYTSKDLPTWVSAGMYSYVLNADIQKDKIVVGNPSYWQTLDPAHADKVAFLEHHVPFSEIIDDKITSSKYRESLQAQYWLMIDYMMSTPENRQKLSHYVDLVSSGHSSADAFKEAVGIDPDVFEKLITTYNKSGFPVMEYKVAALDPKDFQLERLPDFGEPVPLLSAAAQACPGLQYRDTTIARLQKAARTLPENAYVQRELARSEILLGRAEDAKAYIEGTGEPSVPDYDFYYLKGRYYLSLAEDGNGSERSTNYEKARLNLGKAYQLSGTSAPVLYYYARAFEDRPDYPNENTVMALRQAEELLPDAGYEYYLRANFIKNGKIVDEYTRLIAEKQTVEYYDSRAFYRPKSQYNESLQDIDHAIQIGPDSDKPYIVRSHLKLEQGDLTGALADANKALDLSPDDYAAFDARAVAYIRMSKLDLAIKDLEQSVYLKPSASALNGACWTLATHDHPDKAIAYCNRAISQSPTFAGVWDSRAFAELRLNQLDAANSDYTHALGLNANLSPSWYGRGLVELKQGHADQGNQDQKRASLLDPAIETEFATYLDGEAAP